MKKLALCIAYCMMMMVVSAQTDMQRSLDELNDIIQQVPQFDKQKQDAINQLKQQLHEVPATDLYRQFELCTRLYEAYKVFQYDSAYNYAKKLQAISYDLGNPSIIAYAKIKLGFSLLSSGMYKETLDSLSRINISQLPDSSRAEYFALMARYYYDLGDFDNDKYHTPVYTIQAARYIDSALAIWPKDSYEYMYYQGLKELKSGNKANALENFNRLLERKNLTPHQLAVTASTLSDLYIQSNQNDKAIELLARAVKADIQSSTKETSAAFILASLLYKKGDIKNASICIDQAFADAVFYSARQRKVQMSAILPLIEAEKLNIVEGQKKIWIFYAISVTFLLLVVIFLVVVISRQVKKLKAAQQKILQAHEKEQETNRRLAEINEKLSDANKIKEEYIGYFFNVNSEFFDKIERFKRSVEQKIADRKLEDIRFLVNNINLKKEKEELLKHFDKAFLKLFPNFVEVFNSLFREEDRIQLKEDELLNTDLRIFALIRMGIHDNEKIAHILQYSVNTINTYKTKIKNKSIVPNEEFEQHIMSVKTV